MTTKTNLFFATLMVFSIGVMGQKQNKISVDTLYAQDIRATKLLYPNLFIVENGQPVQTSDKGDPIIFKSSIPITYPRQAMMNGTQGTVYTRFLIDTLGFIKDIKIIKGLGDGCSEEIIRILNIMAKDVSKPLIIDGKKMTIYQKLYFKFTLD